MVCTPPSASATSRSRRYSGRKSWPHCETQWASSMARQSIERLAQHGERVVAQQPLGRDVEQAQRALAQALRRSRRRSLDVGRGIEARRLDAELAQLRDLVAHQRDQRRDDQRQALADERRKLEAERLAAAGRHHREHVLAAERRGEDLLLAGAEAGKAVDAAQAPRAPSPSAAIACVIAPASRDRTPASTARPRRARRRRPA